jgi:ribosomal protein S12 methylthiotransferase
LEWIRLHYAYPHKFPLNIIDVMKSEPKICNYLDMPLQHISDQLLTSMKRQITSQDMYDLIAEIRRRNPAVALRSTFIVGYPGETLEHIEELKEFLQEIQFDRVGVFTYSHEENTGAYDLEDTISDEEKERRAQDVMAFQQDISLARNEEKIGQTFKVIIDRKEAGRYMGRTEFDSVEVDNEVIINTDKEYMPGDFVHVKIDKAYDYDLEGSVVHG